MPHPHSYQKFVAAGGFTNLADGIAMIAWAWLASLLTRDPLLIALVPAILRSPWVLFSIPAGIITDRTDRRTLILRMDALRLAVFLILAVIIWTQLPLDPPQASGVSEPLLFYVLVAAALLVGMAEVFRDNAAQTILPSIVAHEHLERANGRLWSLEMISNSLLGPVLGAYLIHLSLLFPFAANAAFFLLAYVLMGSIRGQFQAAPKVQKKWRQEFQDGYDFLRQAPLLRNLAWLTGFSNLFFHMSMIALVLHVQENLMLDVRDYGTILAISAMGGIAGGLVGDRVIGFLGHTRATQFGLASAAPMFACMALAPNMLLLGLALAISGFTAVIWNTVTVSYRQRAIPDALLGRVNSLYRLLAWGMMPLGILMSGVIVSLVDTATSRSFALTAPFWAAAVGSAIMVGVGWGRIREGFENQAIS